MRKLYFILSLVLFTGICLPSKATNLTANVSSIDITPPLEMKYTLGGYGERMNAPAEGIHDRIWAKALAFQNEKQKYVIVEKSKRIDKKQGGKICSNRWTCQRMDELHPHPRPIH